MVATATRRVGCCPGWIAPVGGVRPHPGAPRGWEGKEAGRGTDMADGGEGRAGRAGGERVGGESHGGGSGGADPAPLPTMAELADEEALLVRARAELRDAWGPDAPSDAYRKAQARRVAARETLQLSPDDLNMMAWYDYHARRGTLDDVMGHPTELNDAPSKLIAAAHALDDAWTQQMTAREDVSPEQTQAAVLAYQVGLVLAVDELQQQMPVFADVPCASGDAFFDHDFSPAAIGAVRASGDEMGADVHHAALAVALVRKCDRGVALRNPESALEPILFQLQVADRACLHRSWGG